MIPTVRLAKSGIVTSQLGLGTSRLHHLGRSERERLLSAALDLGWVHFDTAPSYGDGLAETALGRAIRGRRDRVVIATKYGIPPDAAVERFPIRAVFAARSLVRRVGLWRQRRPPLTATGLRTSVERSLRRLGTDRIDLLLLHEASPDRLAGPAELMQELSRLKQRGLLRGFGLAGNWAEIGAVFELAPALGETVQTGEHEWPDAMPPDITYGALSSGLRSADAPDRLRRALARRPAGVVLVSTSRVAHLAELVQATERTVA